MASLVYNYFKARNIAGSVDLDTDTIKVALVTSAYTPDKDAHHYRSSVTNEVTGTGYTAGGATLSGKTVAEVDASDWAKFDATDVTWASSNISARAAVLYKSTGAAAADILIAYVDFGATKTSSGGDFVIQWATDGIMTLA